MLLQLELEYDSLFEPERILFHTQDSIPLGMIYSNGKWISKSYQEIFEFIVMKSYYQPVEIRVGSYTCQKDKTESIIVL
jgi:hypothetical protein